MPARSVSHQATSMTVTLLNAGTRNPTAYTYTYTYTYTYSCTYSYSIERLADVTSGNVYVYRFAECEYGFVAPSDDPQGA